jgi:hypothetical protein
MECAVSLAKLKLNQELLHYFFVMRTIPFALSDVLRLQKAAERRRNPNG